MHIISGNSNPILAREISKELKVEIETERKSINQRVEYLH